MEESSTNNELSANHSETATSENTLECCPSQLVKFDEPVKRVDWATQTEISIAEQLDESAGTKSDVQTGCTSSDGTKTYAESEMGINSVHTFSQMFKDLEKFKISQTYEDGETLETSDEDGNLTEPNQSNRTLEVKESKSLESYKSSMERLNEEAQNEQHPSQLDESYRIMEHLNLSQPIDEGRPQQPSRPDIGARLLELLTDGSKWDIKVYVGDYKFYCHLCVLQAYSPHFRQFKAEETAVVRLPTHKVTAQTFHIVYNWMLHDNPPQRKRFSNRCLLEIYSSAKFLGIAELIDAVWNTLDVIKNENEAFTLLPDVNYVDMDTFDFLCFSRISRFFLTLVASQEFVDMNENFVCRLLSSHNVGVNSEIEIFYAAVRWLSHNWPKRKIAVPQLLKCVRFGLLSPIFLRFLQSEQTTRVMHYIAKSPLVQDQINRAFIYVSAELYCKDPKQSLPFALPEYDVPEQRRWLYDKNCPYHHDLMCSQRLFFTYDQFHSYLESLHETGPDYWRSLQYLKQPVNCCLRLLDD